MKKMIIWYGVLLIIGHLLGEAHSILRAFYPLVATTKLDLFWSSSPVLDIEVQWYVKMLCDDINLCIIFFVLTNVAYKYSAALFFVSSVFFLYHVIEVFLFMYNYKRSTGVYWLLLAAVIISVYFLITKRKIYDYKSMI